MERRLHSTPAIDTQSEMFIFPVDCYAIAMSQDIARHHEEQAKTKDDRKNDDDGQASMCQLLQSSDLRIELRARLEDWQGEPSQAEASGQDVGQGPDAEDLLSVLM